MCEHCSLTFVEATNFNSLDVVEFLIEHDVLKSTTQCKRCGSTISLNRKSLVYSCNKKVSINKKKKAKCAFRPSALVGSFFERMHKDFVVYWNIVAYLLHLKPPRQELIVSNMNVSVKTVVAWLSHCREVFIDDSIRSSSKIGGRGKIVEIDEAIFKKSKRNCGRFVMGQGVFGGIEKGSKNSFYVPVEKRDSDTFLTVLGEWILPGTTIVNNCWEVYKDLDQDAFTHFMVNHSVNVVYPKTEDTTEISWCEVRIKSRFGVKKAQTAGYLAEFHFKRRHSQDERLHHFFSAAARLYPLVH